MSVVASVQAKVNATEKATVQQANEAAATATAQAVQMAESVAGTAQANSIASSTSSTTTTTSSTTSSMASTQAASGGFSLQSNTQTSVVSVSALKPYTPSTDSTVNTTGSSSVVPGLDVIRVNTNNSTQVSIVQQQQDVVQLLQSPQQVQQQPAQMYQAPVTVTQPTVNYSLTEPSNFNFDTIRKQEVVSITEVEIPKTDTFKMGTRSTLNDYINEQPFMALMGMEPTQDGMVKRNVQPNEAAGGVDIASIATQPKGYDAYAQMTLKDASFYKVEDIYKNQRNVDNASLLRGLQRGSDRLHQELVDQQYKLGR
jgi:hypothetical protein